MKFMLLFVTSIIVSFLIFKYISAPFVGLVALWFVVFLYLTITDKRSKVKPIWFNIGFLIVILGCIETAFWTQDRIASRAGNRSGHQAPTCLAAALLSFDVHSVLI